MNTKRLVGAGAAATLTSVAAIAATTAAGHARAGAASAPAISLAGADAANLGAAQAVFGHVEGPTADIVRRATSATPVSVTDESRTVALLSGDSVCLSIQLTGDVGPAACGSAAGVTKTISGPASVYDGHGGWILGGIAPNGYVEASSGHVHARIIGNVYSLHVSDPTTLTLTRADGTSDDVPASTPASQTFQ